MKNFLLSLIFILFTFSIKCQTFSGKVTYEVKLTFTKENLKQMELNNNKATNTMRKVLQNSTDTNVLLKFTSNQSHYEVIKKLEINDRKPLNMTYSIAGGSKQYITDLIVNKNTMKECELLEECFLIEQPVLKWELTQETKLVGGYICYKAINISSKNKKKKPVAWYTPQIPASFGPKHYFGLPGLILELEETAVVFKVKEIILNPKEEVKVIVKEGTKISQEEYNKKLKKAFTQFYEN